MKHVHLILAAASVLSLAACQKPAASEPATPAATESAPAAVVQAPPEAPAPASAAFEMRTFAGRFAGTLACASCPGIDTVLDLAADGTYRLDETYQGEKDGQHKSDGTWTSEENGKRLRLDPNSKQEDDRQFEVLSKDEIRLLDREGNHIDSQMPYNLKRTAPAQ